MREKKGARRTKRPMVAVPQSLAEAAELVRRVGEALRATEEVRLELAQQVEKLKANAAAEAALHEEMLGQLIRALRAYAEENRKELTKDGTLRTVRVPAGVFGWRMTPPAVSFKNKKEVLAAIEQMELAQFIRIKKEPDKETMLKEPAVALTVPGVSISQREEFIVKPDAPKVTISLDGKRLKTSGPKAA